MKFLSHLILALFLVLPMLGCSQLKPGCIIENKVVAASSSAIAAGLQCSNADAITTDLQNILKPLNLCPATTGDIANAFCPLVVSAVTGFVGSKVLPPAWGCSPTAAIASLNAILLSACQKIPVSN